VSEKDSEGEHETDGGKPTKEGEPVQTRAEYVEAGKELSKNLPLGGETERAVWIGKTVAGAI
jgi:hypothetical protein